MKQSVAHLIKTPEQIEKMRVAGKLAADVLVMIKPYVKAGVSTLELETLCHDYIVNVQKAIPACVGYGGGGGRPAYQYATCISVNHVVCHGIPSANKILKKGDILNIDVTVIKDGYHGDTSMMYIVGEPSVLAQRLCDVTQEALYIGMEVVKAGAYVGDIGHAIQRYVEAERFSVVREFCGHGIGEKIHDEPQIVHYGQKGTGMRLEAGMTFTIEPMINAGGWQTKILGDKWTAVTKDHSLSAQYEHTVLVTETGLEVLTARPDEDLSRFKI
ncbi:type I methionyl aminopeptidase [Moraxella sp. ZY210820]|uniref:type I methionyl aminopeptidase n=1 Tax=unclassified Moraxella TaxID=2685852 RepID=UPI002730F2A5|nr:type I methionyl aminopeptidase [Moraxella sp. ZY210820]WLF83439.1 type I methionyl aminopeptidase [Moraxella sp. ZY210820]